MPTCNECGEDFDSERGLHVHEAQVHGDSSSGSDSPSGSEGYFSFELKAAHAILLAFLIGVFAGGFFMSTIDSFTGVTGDTVQAENQPSQQDTQNNDDPSPTQNEAVEDTIDPSEISLEGEPVLGQSDAPVTMVIYEDFECPFCKRFEENAVPQIVSNYVDTGDVKFVWKDLPLPERVHPWADDGAAAMECVFREGGDDAFWNVKDEVFANQDQITESNVYDNIKQYASEEGVSESAIQQCLDNDNPMDEVNADKQGADSVGATGTPTVFINGKKIVGAQPYSVFESVIDSELNG
ncbi:MAG: DsbA family protein [Candidatus Nanohaloarchaeota archaeon QJJ-7]|nr:DsbA family protein [Candidatus Nanohaloarchaeota archaeon QJJ-7]